MYRSQAFLVVLALRSALKVLADRTGPGLWDLGSCRRAQLMILRMKWMHVFAHEHVV